jgi:mono/diheme cytochrome c family protein
MEQTMMAKRLVVLAIFFLGLAGPVFAQTRAAVPRGELLYSTHCIGCHNTQLHWRNGKAARNWASLKSEVERWQKTSGLGWGDEDVTDVARYLNARYYRYPESRVGAASTADANAPVPAR